MFRIPSLSTPSFSLCFVTRSSGFFALFSFLSQACGRGYYGIDGDSERMVLSYSGVGSLPFCDSPSSLSPAPRPLSYHVGLRALPSARTSQAAAAPLTG